MAAIAFIGLGNMGRPMAANLMKAGHTVTGFDLSDAAMERHRAAGGRAATSLAAATAGAEAVFTMLPGGREAAAVYEGEDGVLAHAETEALLVDCSTIDVGTARRLAAAAARGRLMLDAPVSGGVAGAEAASLTFMVGGPQQALDRATPLLEAMGRAIIHTGEAGAGQAAKMCNNLILGASMIAVCEAFVLADRLGLDRDRLFEVASRSSGQCWALTTYCPVPGPVPASPANNAYRAGFTAAMMLKDLRLAAEAARGAGAPVPLAAAAAELYSLYCNAGHGGTDFSGIFRFLQGNSK